MKKLVLITALACGINALTCFAYPVLTEQDRRSIALTHLTEGQKRLAEYFVSYARAEGQRVGVDPALAFAQSPTGVDDREYRRDRLRELREKREARAFQIERLQSRESLKESLPRDEAVPLVAKQIGVSPDKTQMLLAKYEPSQSEVVSEEDGGQTMDADKLFRDKAPAVSQKDAERMRKTQEAEERKAAERAKQDAKRLEKETKDEEKKRLKDKKAKEKQQEKEKKAEAKEEQKRLKEEYSPFYDPSDPEKAPADSKPPESVSTLERVAPADVSMAAILNSKKQVPILFPEDYVYTPDILSEEGK